MVRRPAPRLQPGIALCSRRVLQVAVALLGTQLSIAQGVAAAVASLPVLLGTLVIALVASVLLGRALGVGGNLRALIGAGTDLRGKRHRCGRARGRGDGRRRRLRALTTVFASMPRRWCCS